ncbi:DNA sulfur modification protein DndB [Paenibacillus cremeus]|nr:DNA sulfur modification protein DndB [Paenibacillus cremeus]
MSNVAENLDLIDALSLVLQDVNKKKEQQMQIDDELAKHHIPRGRFNEILIHNERLDQLSQEELTLLTIVVHKITDDKRIDPKSFYSSREINKALKYEYESELPTFPYTIVNVIRTGKTEFITAMSYKEIVGWYLADMITYNFKCQRLPIEKATKKGKVTVKPKTVKKSVEAIADKMLKGDFSTDTIIFNILVNGNDKIEYDNGDLTIYEGTEVDIIDGWHRLQGMVRALQIDPNLEGYMNVSIKHYTLKKAQEALGQFNTVNPFDKVLAKHYNEKGSERNIAKRLMDDSALEGKVSIRTRVDKKLGQLTNIDVLSKSIGTIFEIKNDLEEEMVFEHLKRFFGILLNSYPEHFKTNILAKSKEDWLNHHNTFVGYCVIAKHLYDNKSLSVESVTQLVNSIDMSKDSEYGTIMKEQGNRNSNQTKDLIRKFFEKQVKGTEPDGNVTIDDLIN